MLMLARDISAASRCHYIVDDAALSRKREDDNISGFFRRRDFFLARMRRRTKDGQLDFKSCLTGRRAFTSRKSVSLRRHRPASAGRRPLARHESPPRHDESNAHAALLPRAMRKRQ